MNTTAYETEPVAVRAWAEKRMIYLELTDGRIVGFPADRFKILNQASDHQLKEVQVEVGGSALRWEKLDEDGSAPDLDIEPIQVQIINGL
jgi:hypothetical protein